jgi:outer membrane protein TolC
MRAVLCAFFLFLIPFASAQNEPLPFRRAIELALQHSSGLAAAIADRERAQHSVEEQKYQFIPQLIAGSGLAATYGFPMSIEGAAPTAFSVNTQSMLFNPGQMDFIRSAKNELNAANFSAADRRQQVILDAASTYSQLDTVSSAISVTKQQLESAERAEKLVSDRVQEGVDPEVELTKAKLATAKVRMSAANLQGTADVLRMHLGALTGLPAAQIITATETIPALPEIKQQDDLAQQAAESSPAVRAATEQADAKELKARGERKLRFPTVDLAGQYGLFTKYNNYDQYFNKFQRNNATFGVQIRIPIFNASGRAHAAASEAEAERARKDTDVAKQQFSEGTLKLQRSLQQLAAAREVSKLEHQLARGDVEATAAKVEAGTASFKDQEAARIAEDEKYMNYLNSSFILDQTQMQLMKATGELESWALGK